MTESEFGLDFFFGFFYYECVMNEIRSDDQQLAQLNDLFKPDTPTVEKGKSFVQSETPAPVATEVRKQEPIEIMSGEQKHDAIIAYLMDPVLLEVVRSEENQPLAPTPAERIERLKSPHSPTRPLLVSGDEIRAGAIAGADQIENLPELSAASVQFYLSTHVRYVISTYGSALSQQFLAAGVHASLKVKEIEQKSKLTGNQRDYLREYFSNAFMYPFAREAMRKATLDPLLERVGDVLENMEKISNTDAATVLDKMRRRLATLQTQGEQISDELRLQRDRLEQLVPVMNTMTQDEFRPYLAQARAKQQDFLRGLAERLLICGHPSAAIIPALFTGQAEQGKQFVDYARQIMKFAEDVNYVGDSLPEDRGPDGHLEKLLRELVGYANNKTAITVGLPGVYVLADARSLLTEGTFTTVSQDTGSSPLFAAVRDEAQAAKTPLLVRPDRGTTATDIVNSIITPQKKIVVQPLS